MAYVIGAAPVAVSVTGSAVLKLVVTVWAAATGGAGRTVMLTLAALLSEPLLAVKVKLSAPTKPGCRRVGRDRCR